MSLLSSIRPFIKLATYHKLLPPPVREMWIGRLPAAVAYLDPRCQAWLVLTYTGNPS